MKNLKLKRVYRKYQEWEEVTFNMWGTVSNKEDMLNKAIQFTSDYKLYGTFMQRVVKEWHVSCENALTDSSINQKAWVGHAATALALRCPENITREAWKHLTYEQQLLANKEAERAIRWWKNNYRESKRLLANMAQPMLFE